MKVEYKVRAVTKYIVTRYEESGVVGKAGYSSKRGEFDNFDTAYHVGYAMAKLEHEQLGYAPGDMRIIYPESRPLGGVDTMSSDHLRLLWDNLDDNSFLVQEIHAELNKRGEGDYCAV